MRKKIRQSSLQFHIDSLLNIYGKPAEPYTAELCFLIEGISQIYLECMILLGYSVKPDQLADIIMNRIDDMVKGMSERHDKPFITLEEASSLFGPLTHGRPDPLTESIVKSLRDKINSLNTNSSLELSESLDILEAEMKKKTPKLVIIKGMIHNLTESEALAKDAEQLKYLLKQQYI